MENIGEQIYKLRAARGLSQLELAEKLEVSRQSISKWETNAAVPELAKLVKMAQTFEITLDALILGKEETEEGKSLSYEMNDLGEALCRHRTACGLSQLALAESLAVSRQSISKWETNAAVPELAKLVKMAEIFGVTLDALLLKQKTEEEREVQTFVSAVIRETVTEVKREEKKQSAIKTAFGVIFVTVGALFSLFCLVHGAWVAAVGFLIPSVMSAFFCFKQFRFAALWCVETWYGYLLLWCAEAMNISLDNIWITKLLLSMTGTNPMRVVIAWLLFVGVVILIAVTVFVYRKHTFALDSSKRVLCGVGVLFVFPMKRLIALIYPRILCLLFGFDSLPHLMEQLTNSRAGMLLWIVLDFFVDTGAYVAFTVCLVPTFWGLVSLIRQKRERSI